MCVDRYRRRHRLRMPSTVLGDGAPAIVWEGILQLQVMRDGAHSSRLDAALDGGAWLCKNETVRTSLGQVRSALYIYNSAFNFRTSYDYAGNCSYTFKTLTHAL